MHDGVAQHVFERRQHALEHLAIELTRCAFNNELGALVRVRCNLTHQSRQTLHVTLERDHARAHESALQLGHNA